MNCMSHPSCGDICCQYGVDVSTAELEKISERSAEVVALLGKKTEWFDRDPTIGEPDEEFPDGRIYRTLVGEKGCVFLGPKRGCVLHGLGLKPHVCTRAFFNADGKTLDEDIEWLPCKAQWIEEMMRRQQEGAPAPVADGAGASARQD